MRLSPRNTTRDFTVGAGRSPGCAAAVAGGAPADAVSAAGAFELWRGVMPDTAPVLAALRARLEAAP